MRTINNLLQSALKIDIVTSIENSIDKNKDVLIKQQQDQMYSGYGSDDKSINPLHGRYTGYADRTRIIKRSKGQIDKWVTLKDEGDMYSEIFVDLRSKEFVMDSADPKTQGLIDYYGEQIFGFNEESKKDLKEPLSNALAGEVKNELNKR